MSRPAACFITILMRFRILWLIRSGLWDSIPTGDLRIFLLPRRTRAIRAPLRLGPAKRWFRSITVRARASWAQRCCAPTREFAADLARLGEDDEIWILVAGIWRVAAQCGGRKDGGELAVREAAGATQRANW